MSDRKYRQRGYQDRSDESTRQKPAEKPARKDDTFGPRPLQMPGTRTVSRCSQCGTLLQAVADPAGKCPKCGSDVHSCMQGTYFDPRSLFERGQQISEPISRKNVRNTCTSYTIR